MSANQYKFEREKGLIVVIVNKTFTHEFCRSREIAEVDLNNMKELSRLFECKIEYIEDGSKAEAEMFLDSIVECIQEGNVEWLMVVVSTHGGLRNNGRVLGDHALLMTDSTYDSDKVIFTKDLVARFKDNSCPALKDKPKLFFIQACRGMGRDQGVFLDGPGETESPPRGAEPTAPECPQIDIDKDMLIMFGSTHGNVAFKDDNRQGSLLIHFLFNHLREVIGRPERIGLLLPLTKVIEDMAKIDIDEKVRGKSRIVKTIGEINHRLVRNIYI